MDIGKSFTYVFDDEQWVQKVVIGALLLLASIIPIVNIFTALVVVGYALRVLKNVSDGAERPLPNWDNWGEDWIKGLLFVLGMLIYALPAILVGGIAAIITAITAGKSGEPSGGAQICIFGLQCLTWIWGLLVALWQPAVMIRFAREGRFAAMFEFGALWSLIRAHAGDYIIAIIITFVAQFLSMFGVILCVIGVFLTAFWALLVEAHIYGQVGAPAAPAAVGGEGDFLGPTTYGELTEAPPSTPEEEPKGEE